MRYNTNKGTNKKNNFAPFLGIELPRVGKTYYFQRAKKTARFVVDKIDAVRHDGGVGDIIDFSAHDVATGTATRGTIEPGGDIGTSKYLGYVSYHDATHDQISWFPHRQPGPQLDLKVETHREIQASELPDVFVPGYTGYYDITVVRPNGSEFVLKHVFAHGDEVAVGATRDGKRYESESCVIISDDDKQLINAPRNGLRYSIRFSDANGTDIEAVIDSVTGFLPPLRVKQIVPCDARSAKQAASTTNWHLTTAGRLKSAYNTLNAA